MAQPVIQAVQPETQKLGAGLHAATIEFGSERSFRVRTLSGVRCTARLLEGVELELIEHCLRTNQLVILTDSEQGPAILGALQTQKTLYKEPDDTLVLEATRIELRAAEKVRVRSGASSLELQSKGKVRINSHRLLLDVNTNVRVLSALVELP